jgi:hypothetical protein
MDAIITQFNASPLRSYFPIQHATSITPILISTNQTNQIHDVARGSVLWWIDGIEIPADCKWSDLTYFRLTIGGDANYYRIPLQPLLRLSLSDDGEKFWRFPFSKLFQQSIPIISLQYHNIQFSIEATSLFNVKVYQGLSFLDNTLRRSLAEGTQEIKIRNISQAFVFQGTTLVLNRQVNFVSTGFILHTNNLLNKLKISIDGQQLMEYNETMLNVYAKKCYIWKMTEEHKKSLQCVSDLLGVPDDLIGVIENQIGEDTWWWIPFAPNEDIWKWDFTDLSLNMSRINQFELNVEPAQNNTEIYFITYNIMMIMHGMAGMKFRV